MCWILNLCPPRNYHTGFFSPLALFIEYCIGFYSPKSQCVFAWAPQQPYAESSGRMMIESHIEADVKTVRGVAAYDPGQNMVARYPGQCEYVAFGSVKDPLRVSMMGPGLN